MAPAHERLHSGATMTFEIENSLVMQLELLPTDRPAQIVLKLPVFASLCFHPWFEKAKAIAAFRFGLIKRQICVLDQSIRGRAIPRRDCNANAGPNIERAPIEIVGLPDRLQNAIGQRDRALLVIRLGSLKHGKFVATQPRHTIGLARRFLQPARNFLQQSVSGRMTERVVDGLEPIKVKHQNRKLLTVRARPTQRFGDFFGQQCPVRKPCQTVIASHLCQLRLNTFLLCDVLVDGNPSPSIHHLARNADGASVSQNKNGTRRTRLERFFEALNEQRWGLFRGGAGSHASLHDVGQRSPGLEVARRSDPIFSETRHC